MDDFINKSKEIMDVYKNMKTLSEKNTDHEIQSIMLTYKNWLDKYINQEHNNKSDINDLSENISENVMKLKKT